MDGCALMANQKRCKNNFEAFTESAKNESTKTKILSIEI
jgi:hypothetical protein